MAYNPNNVNGQATSANSAPVVLASDQSAIQAGAKYNATPPTLADGGTSNLQFDTRGSLRVTLVEGNNTNGVNQVNTNSDGLGTDASRVYMKTAAVPLLYNGTSLDRQRSSGPTGTAAVAGSYLESTFTTTTVQAVSSSDVSAYKWVSVQINTQGTASTVAFQQSNDNTNWYAVGLLGPGSGNNPINQTGSVGLYTGPLQARYFRLNVTGISAGTTAGVVEYYTVPPVTRQVEIANANVPVTIQSGTNTIGSTVMLTAAGVNVLTGNGVTGTGSLRVTLASDTSTNTNPLLMAEQKSSTAAITSVTGATTSTTILAANTARKGMSVFNESTAVLYLAFAATASTTTYTVQIPAGGFYEMPLKPIYLGLLTGIWSSANGSARVTELT